MKEKTKRKIRRFWGFWGVLFAICNIAFIKLGLKFIAGAHSFLVSYICNLTFITFTPATNLRLTSFLVSCNTTFLSLLVHVFSWSAVLVLLYVVNKFLYHIYLESLTSKSGIAYFKKVDFGKHDEDTIRKVVVGILNPEKVEPFFVHAAPRCEEVGTIKSRLKETGFAMVFGGPGEGKSMAVYHAAYEFQKKGYCVYELKTDRLEKKKWEEIYDKLFLELDLKGRKKLIIVDDIHKLEIRPELIEHLQLDASEGGGKYIIIETEFYKEQQDKSLQTECIRIDFRKFFGEGELVKNFYQSHDPILQKALEGHTEGLKDAIDRVKEGKIRDAWHFAFVASRGEEKLAQETSPGHLSRLELLTLFLISSHTVLSGEKEELSEEDLLDVLRKVSHNFQFGWLDEALGSSSFGKAIGSLQERTPKHRPMIRIYDKNEYNRGYNIALFHYNFARAVIRVSLLREKLAKDLLLSVRELLTSEYHKCTHIAVFNRDIGTYAKEFVRENKDWLINFVNNPLPKLLKCYNYLLWGIRSIDKNIYDEIIKNLNIPKIAEKANSTGVEHFQQLACLLNAIGSRRDELIKELDLAQLSKAANSAGVKQFSQLVWFLNAIRSRRLDAIRSRRDELIKGLDLAQLSKTANSAEVGQFQQLADLLGAIGNRRRDEMIKDKNFDLAKLAQKACTADIEQFGQIETLSIALGDKKDVLTKELVKKPNLSKLARKANAAKVEQFQQLAHLLGAIGNCRDELIRELDLAQLAEKANSVGVEQFGKLAYLLNAMGDRRDKLIRELDLAQLGTQANKAKIKEFGQIADLMVALGNNRNKLIEKIDLELLAKTCNNTDVEVKQFDRLAQLLRELENYRNKLIKKLDFEKLAKTANTAGVDQFEQIAELLKELGESKSQLSILLDHNTLVQKAKQAGQYDIMGLTMLMTGLEEKERNKYIQGVDWTSLCLKCPIYVYLISPLGASLENLWKQNEISPNSANIERVIQHLRTHYAKIKEEIGKVNPKLYSGMAKFLWSCNKFDPALARQIATETMVELVNRFRVGPTEYQGAGRLINALYAVDPNISASFVKDNRIRGKIQQSINEDDWSKEIEGLKHLIKAFYRSAPELWKKMISHNWLIVDLSSLDLNSIYDKVDEEKNTNTPDNIV